LAVPFAHLHKKVLRRPVEFALSHPIVLMHDPRAGEPATVTALPAIIQFFRSHGYRFVAL